MTWRPESRGNLLFFRSSLFHDFPEIGHAITTRIGGSSSGPYESLNLVQSTGDDPKTVEKNRTALCSALDLERKQLRWCYQVLGSEVVALEDLLPRADGMVTQDPGVATLTFSADCLLLMLYDPKTKTIANVHSSRTGARGRIAQNAVKKMTEECGTLPENIMAAVGPSIGSCCYHLGKDAIQDWNQNRPDATDVIQEGRMDLWLITRRDLETAGVPPDHIDEARTCTRCHPEWFYSYRREGEKSGRFGAVLWIR